MFFQLQFVSFFSDTPVMLVKEIVTFESVFSIGNLKQIANFIKHVGASFIHHLFRLIFEIKVFKFPIKGFMELRGRQYLIWVTRSVILFIVYKKMYFKFVRRILFVDTHGVELDIVVIISVIV